MPRINFLFVLILLLTACTPNATLAPLPTVTSSPVVSITPTIAATEIRSIANPISPENMDLLTRAGYQWDEQSGELKMANGFVALILQNGKWLDPRTGVEMPLEALKPVAVNTKDWLGNDVGSFLTREVPGRGLEFYNPMINAWQDPVDVEGSVAAVSKNNIPKNVENWKAPVEIDFNGVQEITWDDFHSGRLWMSEILYVAAHPIDSTKVIKPLVISRAAIMGHTYVIDQYQIGWVDGRDEYEANHPPDMGLNSQNDSREMVSTYKMKSPIEDGQWLVQTGIRLQYQGQDLVFHVFSGDELVKPTEQGGGWHIMEQVWSSPSQRILMPVISAWEGGQSVLAHGESATWNMPSQTVLDLVRFDYLEAPGDMIPPHVNAWMYQEGWNETDSQWDYASGDWVFRLQGTVMPGVVEERTGAYFAPPDTQSQWDPAFPPNN